MVLAITHDGEVLRQLEDDEAIGAPAVMGRYAFLPWQGQYVTVFDLLRGEEVARALLRTKVSRAFMTGGAMFFGGAAATRLDERIRFGAEDRASTVALPARELPGMPRWITPGIEVQGPAATALDKTQIYARPTASGPPAIEGRRFAATYFRVAVGFDATSGEVAWAHVGEADYLGGAAYSGGFALCDARGEVSLLEAQLGRVAGSVSLGRPVDACVVQADGITGKAGVAAEPLWRQLDRVVAAPDAELAAIQRFLLRELAALPDEEVTRALVTLASGERGSPALLEDARRALAGRRNGATFMLAALSRRYDFLAGALKPPPVGPLADALAAMGERKAAPLLAAHLLDPATSPGDVERAAAALVTLAGPAELSALRNFFAMYRGLDDNEALGEAVVRVAEALVQVGAANVVARAAKDPFTSPALRERIEAALRGKRAAQ
jgi:outer membrane protein assembly factor BamB